jgi:hypothetical protein
MNSNEIILEKLTRIETKLDEVIKALHEYDDDFDDEEIVLHNIPNEALLEAKKVYDEYVANKRMDVIGQNGNEGLHYDSHYVTNEEADEDAFNDYSERVVDKDKNKSNNTQTKHVGKKKYNNKYYKKSNTPVTPKK